MLKVKHTPSSIPGDSVLALAQRVQSDQGWCDDGVKEALEGLGFEFGGSRVRFEVTLTIEADALVSDDSLTRSFIQDSVRSYAGSEVLDSDFENVEIVDVRSNLPDFIE